MFRRNISLFRLWGIPVELNLSWIIVLILISWTFATGYYPENFPGLFMRGERWILGFLTAILLFTSILLHEFSHSYVAVRNGLPIRRITLFMFGGVAQMEREADNPVLELKMAAAGPCMTIVLAAVFFGLFMALRSVPFAAVLFRSLVTVNIGVFVFNMVPGFPLDGGRILRAAIWYKTGNVRVATRITSRIGSGFAYILMGLGFFSFLVLSSLIGGLWLIFIGFFLRQAAQSGYLMVAFKEAMRDLKVGDVMRTGIIRVESSITLRQLVDDYFLKYHFGTFPVMKDGALVGIVSLKEVKEIERDRWDESIVENVMDRNITRWILHPSDPAEKLLQLILNRGYGRLPVADDSGNLVGIVTRRDLLDIIKLMYPLGE